jgi:drug/metabolite transporter (DMT)-like permease
MGGMDAASSTLGAIGGALTPGQLQTLLNQTIIPITIAISAFYLNQTFKPNQLIGATCIMGGSILASVPFLTGMSGER